MAAYAFTDLHGEYELWQKIKAYCKPEDKLYFLGDAADRGSEGVRIMIELLTDPRVIYLKGNHEYIMEKYFDTPNSATLDFWLKNGGTPTIEGLISLSEKKFDWLLDKIKQMPYYIFYKNIYMSHSGYYCDLNKKSKLEQNWYKLQLLENRDRIGRDTVKPKEIDYIIHGHTPVQYISQYLREFNNSLKIEPKYYDNFKIGLDLCSIVTGKAALINLDTFEIKIFSIQK